MKKIFILLFPLLLLACHQNKNHYSICDFGAKGDSSSLNTLSIQKAIDAASIKGGTVIVPSGKYITGTIFIKSNVCLQLMPNSFLIGSGNINDYATMTWGHHEDRTPWHLIVAKDAKNIRITGLGTIDGNGPTFWEKERKTSWSFYHEIEYRPSPMVEIQDCENVIIENITITNSAGWTLHPYNSKNVKINGITIKNNLFGPNTDGIDVTGCEDVMISNCNISGGDDAIALKTTEDSKECKRITVTNCILESNCVAVRIGFESRKDFSDIVVSNCVVKNASRAIDLRTFEGGNINNVLFSNINGQINSGWVADRLIEIDADTINTPYSVKIKEHPDCGKKKPVYKVGSITNVRFEGIYFKTMGRIMMAAGNNALVKNISFSDINMQFIMLDDPYDFGLRAEGSAGYFKNKPFVRSERSAIVAENVVNLSVDKLNVSWPVYPITDECLLMISGLQSYNPQYYKGNEEKIRNGEIKPAFGIFSGKNLIGGTIDVSGCKSSEKGIAKIHLVNSDIVVRQ